jgi:hypothetical protein
MRRVTSRPRWTWGAIAVIILIFVCAQDRVGARFSRLFLYVNLSSILLGNATTLPPVVDRTLAAAVIVRIIWKFSVEVPVAMLRIFFV